MNLEFIVEPSLKARVEERVRLTVAPVDGTPRYKITARVDDAAAPTVMRAVMNALDETG
ncbi:MAG TPA: hypothetical protein VE085_05795 [Burkholderiales bacterium]|nr:hypothetical protein [Burkholderiales bacterium]